MRSSERQAKLKSVLLARREDTAANLAAEFGVNERTVRRDIGELVLSLPLETVRGRYGGGVRLCDWFRPSGRYLAPEQECAIRRAADAAGERLSTGERQALLSVLTQFAPPV